MGNLILGIGLPASGKSTMLEALASSIGYVYLSVDEIRAELGISYKDPVVRSENETTIWIWDTIRDRTKMHLTAGVNVIVDATFVSAELRAEFIGIGKGHNAIVIGVFFDTPAEICWERCQTRERQVDRSVFDKRVELLAANPPSLEDGFHYFFSFSGENEIDFRTNLMDTLKS